MTMNEYNGTVVRDVLRVIGALEAGETTLTEVQSALQSAILRFDNDGSGVAEAVRLAEADLEEIQFATQLEEQVSAAVLRMQKLRACLGDSSDA